MARMRWAGGLVLAAVSAAGCVSGPLAENPMRVGPDVAAANAENPLFVPQGPEGYGQVFDRTYGVIQEYFDVAYSNRFDGRIETWPLMSAGYFDPFRLGCYDHYQNSESALQTIRRRAIVLITPAESGGYHIDVQVYKELEDLPKPSHAGTGAAVFRTENPIERQYEVVDLSTPTQGWIPLGRDPCLEQVILARLKNCL